MALTPRRVVWLGIAATILYAAFAAYRIASDSFAVGGVRYYDALDDALISMRYGWNLAHGHGLVWNAGERIEGYTNPLLVLLGAVLTALASKTTAVLLLQVLGAGWVLAAAWLAASIARDVSRDPGASSGRGTLAAAAVFACTLAYYPLFILSLQGMETGLLALLVLWATRLALRPRSSRTPRAAAALSAVLALAYLCRPDGALTALVILAHLWSSALRDPESARGERLRMAAASLAPLAGTVALHLAWRRSYYGSWLPNTYVLKIAGVPLSERIGDGIAFVDGFLVDTAPLLALGAVGVLLGRTRAHALLAALFLVHLAFYVFSGGDFAPELWRFIVPGVPMLLILAVDGALRGSALLAARRGRAAPAFAPLLVVALAVGTTSLRYGGLWLEEETSQLRQRQRDVVAARVIEAITTKDAVVGVIAAGYIPYYSGRPAVDFLGKMDPVIARSEPHRDVVPGMSSRGARMWPGHAKYDLRYSLMERRPDVVEQLRWFDEDLRQWGSRHYWPLRVGPKLLFLRRGSAAIRWELLDCRARSCRLKIPAGPDFGGLDG